MRARIGIALGTYWGGIVYTIDVIAAISVLGAIGGLPALLNALSKYTRFTMRWLRGMQSRSAATSAIHSFVISNEFLCKRDSQLPSC
jgi:predicted MFS family arabinose efflux permease